MGTGQLKGFIAEYWHADTYNINAALRKTENRAFIERSNQFASVDVSTNFGNDYSMKYYDAGADSAKQQALNVIQAYNKYLSGAKSRRTEKIMTLEEYLRNNNYSEDMQTLIQSIYKGQGRVIPSDQLREAVRYLEKQIVKESAKEGINRTELLNSYKETLLMLTDRIKDGAGVESIPLSKKEAEAIAFLAKEGKFRPEDFGIKLENIITGEYILSQALEAGVNAAIITAVMKMLPELYSALQYIITKGELDVEYLKKSGEIILTAAGESFLRGCITSALTIMIKSGKLGEQLTKLDANLIGGMVIIAIDAIKCSCKVAMKKMSYSDMANILATDLVVSSLAYTGGVLGQIVLPELPVIGYMIGNFVGAVLGTAVTGITKEICMSFCVHAGFAFWGMVQQDYVFPENYLETIGIKTNQLEKSTWKNNHMKTNQIKTNCFTENQIKTINVYWLKRGIVGINHIAYI